ncbi:MAG TPA: tetratricopeptide repeat protein, partial [Gemmataceae bacterium]|nr:tetratricopeptide repeat protein [Gemmataceae bacterium]
ARDDFRDALRRDPDHGLARAHLAECLLNTGDPDEAAGHFLQLLEREPNDPTALLGLARCRRRQARPDEAQRLLDRLLAGDAVPVAALVERAGLCQERGAYREAVKWYREALKRDSSDPDACYALARCLRAQGRQKEAQTYEARAAEIEGDLHTLAQLTERMLTAPGDPELPYRAGMICLRNGQKGEARRWFRNALQRAPGHEGARRGLEQLSREQ